MNIYQHINQQNHLYCPGNFGVYQMLQAQRDSRRQGKQMRLFSKVRLENKKPKHQLELRCKKRKALVFTQDESLQNYFSKRLTQAFNFDIVSFVRNRAEFLTQQFNDFSWIIVTEDIKDISLKEISDSLSDHSKYVMIFIGSASRAEVAKYGFDKTFKKQELV
ncbi:MAG: hypothetical protein K0S08_743 [Gammaproteobacteria bacterium]|jgi:hypothetical protein|nr:hypothetical protein [Gammaproteobacteria bacterium]MCE3239296.1 hypothetical protein [Gammaproteobacteria bacterium]